MREKEKKAPKLPENPKGMDGLASLLKYCCEFKAYQIETGIIDANDPSAKLSGLAGIM